jgi:CRISPR-associated protein Csm4
MQSQFDCIKMHFTSPLHLSKGREQYDKSAELLHSDTLCAALFHSAIQLGASEDDVLEMFSQVRITSAFPFEGDNYFFPKPMMALPFEMKGIEKEKQGKPFKKIQYLSKYWFEKAINGENAGIEKEHLSDKKYLSEVPVGVIMKKNVTQRVSIAPDYTDDAKPYFVERVYFGEKAGLYILVNWLGDKHRNLFKQAFRLLGDLGIGTDKSTGNGYFVPEFDQVTLRIPDTPTHQVSLGMFLPAEGEVDRDTASKSAWALSKRGGYMAGAPRQDHISLRKRSVFMFDPGSVFPAKPMHGKIIDLRPDWNGLDYPVWRDGRPLFVSVILG